MLKALLKKQLLEFVSFFTGSGKSGKKTMKKGTAIVLAIVLIYAAIGSGVALYFLFDAICAPLCSVGMSWLFFAIVGLITAGLGIIFGIFTTQPMLYDAKDNDFLLSLPIPASKILFSRMFMLYLQNLLCTLIVFIPAMIAYSGAVGISALPLAFQLVILLVLPLTSLVVECVVGWIVAFVTSLMRNKTIITLVLSVALLGAYMCFTTKTSDFIAYINEHANQLGESVINAFYPFYKMGLGAIGETGGLLIFVGISAALFAAVYLVLSLSFIRIATTKRGAKKVKYTGEILKTKSLGSALIRKELTRFTATPMYMLNCGLGVLFHIVLIVFALIKKEMVLEIFATVPVFSSYTTVMIVAVACLIAAMNCISAPSVSLEGKNLWILQVMPIDGWYILRAKLGLHLIVNLPTSILCVAVIGAVMGVSVVNIVLAVIFTVLYVCFCAVIGLVCNLRMPNLNWTSEAVVIKQGASTLVSMLSNVVTIFAFGGLYYLAQNVMADEIILSIFIVIIFVVTFIFARRLKNNGSKKLMYL